MVATRSKTKPSRPAEPAPQPTKAAEVDPKALAQAIWRALAPEAPLAVALGAALGFAPGGAPLAAAVVEAAPAWAKDGRPRAQQFKQPFIFEDILDGREFRGVRVHCEDTRTFDGLRADRSEAVTEAMRLAREAGAI